MSISKVIRAGGVAVATLGLSTCKDNGAVDPGPPPLDCGTTGASESLQALAERSGLTLHVSVFSNSGQWKAQPAISQIVGATVKDVSLFGEITLELDSADVKNGSFHIAGTITDTVTECPVSRTFNFTIDGNGGVQVSRNDLPLQSRERAAIVLVRRDGHDLELRASGSIADATVGWTATGGSVEVAAIAADRARWRLPAEPGIYQIELLVDRGQAGFVLDTLAIEVT